jgi:hypothetical protein
MPSIYASPPPMPPRYTTTDAIESATSPPPKVEVSEHNTDTYTSFPVSFHKGTGLRPPFRDPFWSTTSRVPVQYPWKALVWILLMVFLFLFRLLYILSGFHILASMAMALCATLLTYFLLRFM